MISWNRNVYILRKYQYKNYLIISSYTFKNSSLSQQIFACFVLFLCRISPALKPVFFQALQFYKTSHEIYRCLNRILFAGRLNLTADFVDG